MGAVITAVTGEGKGIRDGTHWRPAAGRDRGSTVIGRGREGTGPRNGVSRTKGCELRRTAAGRSLGGRLNCKKTSEVQSIIGVGRVEFGRGFGDWIQRENSGGLIR